MERCKTCGGTDFFKEAGYFFCQMCQTQNENIREEVLEVRIDPSTRLRKQKIRSLRSSRSDENLGWTTWELYNFVLIGLTDELIELGITPDIKLTVLQLWATYLGKIEIAFTSSKKKCIPKLAKRYSKRDAEIIYGKIRARKRARKRKRNGSNASTSLGSEYLSGGSSSRDLNRSKRLLANADYSKFTQSQASSDGDGLSILSQSLHSVQSSSGKSSNTENKIRFSSCAKDEVKRVKVLSRKLPRKDRAKYRENHVTTQYKMGAQILTPMRLWAILYLALRIHDEPIHLSEMLRYGREGHLSYYKLDHLLPPEVNVTKSDIALLSQNMELSHKSMRRMIASMAKLLGVFNSVSPDFRTLINRYCQELELPRGVLMYVERLIALSPPKMLFNHKMSSFPNYEGRAMAFIIVVLKMLFALDGITEYEISKTVEKINSATIEAGIVDDKLFSFREWQRFIECRRNILIHSHFPTKFKYNAEYPSVNNLYIKFLESHQSKICDREEPEITNHKHVVPRELTNAIKLCISNITDNNMPLKEPDVFASSYTPLYSYLRQLLDDPLCDLPAVLRTDFYATNVEYIVNPQSIKQLAALCNISLEVIDSSLHFVEKIVPPFEQSRLESVQELKAYTQVEDCKNIKKEITTESNNFEDYAHWKIPCEIKLNDTKKMYYSDSQKLITDTKSRPGSCEIVEESEFIFDEILHDGRLSILTSDSESDEETIDENENELLQSKFCQEYNLEFSTSEKESIRISEMTENKYSFSKREVKQKLLRDATGKFLKMKIKEDNESNDEIFTMSNTFVSASPDTDCTNVRKENCELSSQNKTKTENVSVQNSDDENSQEGSIDLRDCLNLSNISILEEDESEKRKYNLESERNHETLKLYRPLKDYWMYHCIFSRVKPKNFESFRKTLPASFRWLLEECASVIETSADDLYEEVCLVEIYHSKVFQKYDSLIFHTDNSRDSDLKAQRNMILSKW